MGRCIIKIKNSYMEYSTIPDAIVSPPMKLSKFKKYIKKMYGERGLYDLPPRLERLEPSGSSFAGETLEQTLFLNRMGDNGEELTLDEIIKKYKIK